MAYRASSRTLPRCGDTRYECATTPSWSTVTCPRTTRTRVCSRSGTVHGDWPRTFRRIPINTAFIRVPSWDNCRTCLATTCPILVYIENSSGTKRSSIRVRSEQSPLFCRSNPLIDFKPLTSTCSYFRGCPIDKLDVAIAYDLPELVSKYRKLTKTVIN